MSAKPKTRLKSLQLESISLVDAGDNPHADVLLLKRRPGMKPAKKEAPKTTAQILAESELRGEMWDAVYAWQDSLASILCADITPEEKAAMITQSLDEFMAAIKRVLAGGDAEPPAPEIAQPEMMDLSGVLATAKAAGAHVVLVQKWMEDRMPTPKTDPKVEPVVKIDLAAIPEAQRGAVEAVAKRADEATAQLAELTKARDAEKSRADAAEAELAKVAPDPYRGMPEATAAELRKRDERIAKLEQRDAEHEAITKARADGLASVPGTTVEKIAPLLLRVSKGRSTQDDADEIARLLKSLSALAGRALTVVGTGGSRGAADGTAAAEVQKRAGARVAAGKAKSVSVACLDVLADDPELARRYEDEKGAAA